MHLDRSTHTHTFKHILSLSLSVCLPLSLSVCLSLFISLCLLVCLPLFSSRSYSPPVYFSFPSVCLSCSLLIFLSFSAYPFNSLSLSVYLSPVLFIYLPLT